MSGSRAPSARTLRLRGIATVAVIGAVVIAVVANPFAGGHNNTIDFSIVAPSVPDGIQEGVPVVVRGESIGSVCGLDISRPDSTRVDLCVKKSEADELTDGMGISFVSRNLFGSDALQLTPGGGGQRVTGGSLLSMPQPPANYTVTAALRSAGGFTLPVLTPQLSDLLGRVGDASTRLAPFLTATTVALQTVQHGQLASLAQLLPTAADALNGIAAAGGGAVIGYNDAITTPNFKDRPFVQRVLTMIPGIGTLFSGIGITLDALSNFGPALDVVNAFTVPLTTALHGVTPAQVGTLIDHFGGAFHVDPRTGRVTLATQLNLDIAPGVVGPLRVLGGVS